MRKSQELTKSQKQLLYLLPVLNDRQVAGMLSTLKKPARRVEKNDAYRQLMNMTGCAEAKEQLTAMLAAHRMSHIAESRSRTVKQPYFHAVFTGNPGCAKTTCARLYARALAQEGITKHDRFAELTRASLCGKYQGHTAQMVKEVFKQNKGGTIFIDEAYSLASDERDSFGAEAIDEIIVGLENDPGTVVIFAGYPEKMEQFLDANPGLRSRIPYRVRFCDYTADELLEISGKIAADSGFTITADAGEKLLGIFEKERQGSSPPSAARASASASWTPTISRSTSTPRATAMRSCSPSMGTALPTALRARTAPHVGSAFRGDGQTKTGAAGAICPGGSGFHAP